MPKNLGLSISKISPGIFTLLVLILLGIIKVYKDKNTIPNRNNLRRHKKSKKNISTRTEEKRDKEVEIETEKLKGNKKS